MEQEEIHGAHSEGVYEIVPSVSCGNESTSPSQMRCTDIFIDESLSFTRTSCTDVLCKIVCGLNRQGACLSHDVSQFII